MLKNGHIFAVNVLDSDGEFTHKLNNLWLSTDLLQKFSFLQYSGNIVPPKVLLNRLKHVQNSGVAQQPAEYPIGILTTENRDTWAGVRQHLIDTQNESALKTVDTALFCVALDDQQNDPSTYVPIVQNLLHGTKDGVINR